MKLVYLSYQNQPIKSLYLHVHVKRWLKHVTKKSHRICEIVLSNELMSCVNCLSIPRHRDKETHNYREILQVS